jgi:hypothetical protein
VSKDCLLLLRSQLNAIYIFEGNRLVSVVLKAYFALRKRDSDVQL